MREREKPNGRDEGNEGEEAETEDGKGDENDGGTEDENEGTDEEVERNDGTVSEERRGGSKTVREMPCEGGDSRETRTASKAESSHSV